MNAGQRLCPILNPLFDNRVYVSKRMDGQDSVVPYAIYNQITGNPETSQDGYTGHDWVRVQIDIYAEYENEADNLENQAKVLIATKIKPCEIGTTQHLTDGELYRRSFDVEFFTEIPTPTP